MEHILRYQKPAKCFEEALPIGNGSFGAMIYGGTQKDKIPLNLDTLWSGTRETYGNPTAFDAFEKAKEFILQGKIKEAQKEIEERFTSTWLCRYLPMGTLLLENEREKAENYERQLNLRTSLATVTSNGVKKEYLLSYPDQCFVLHIQTDCPSTYTLSGNLLKDQLGTVEDGALVFNGECPSEMLEPYFFGNVPPVYDGRGIRYSCIAKPISDGKIVENGERLTIENAKEVTVFVVAESSFISPLQDPVKPTLPVCRERLASALKKGFSKIKEDHIKDVTALYDRVCLDLQTKENLAPTEKRLKEGNDLGLVELLFNMSRYLLISASRPGSQATNLQGIWNEQYYAPWCSNYTVNINTEMNYWGVHMLNLSECAEPLVSMMKNLSQTGKEIAREYYHARGFVSHHNLDLWMHANPVGGKREQSARFASWNLSSGWLCRNLFECYEYTGDIKLLKETIYPILKESAQFYLDTMVLVGDRYLVTPSSSPENAFLIDGKPYSIAKYATMSQSIVQDLFQNVLKSAKVLGIKDDFVKEIREKADRIGIYQIDSQGRLMEYDREYPEEDIHHRHVSHLYALYPANLISTEKTKALADACRQSLIVRGDESTGWSMGWKVCLWARLKDGDHALKMVKTQLRLVEATEISYGTSGGTYANMLDAHPPFQIDGNYGVGAGICQMFLQSEDGKIRILPALPNDFANGSVKGLKAIGNIVVDITWENHKAKTVKLVTPIPQTAIIEIDGKEQTVTLEAGKEYVIA